MTSTTQNDAIIAAMVVLFLGGFVFAIHLLNKALD
jgi:hypothetical protein